MIRSSFQFQQQHDLMDCGPACLRMIALYYGKKSSLQYLRDKSYITRNGVNMLGISEAAEGLGFKTLSVKVDFQKLTHHAPFPCVVHWQQNHFIVLYKVTKKYCYVADPGKGKLKITTEDFLKGWKGGDEKGIALLIEPGEQFYDEKNQTPTNKTAASFFLKYLRPYKWAVSQLLLAMLAGSGLSLLFPLLMQQMVDAGINGKNIGIVKLILVSQLLVFSGSVAIELVRSWLMLHLNARINISIISDFLVKLMQLPIRFFDSRNVGDIKQRIGDHNRIQAFLTGPALHTLFSLINFTVYLFVMAWYHVPILLVFLLFSALGVGWIFLFLKKRKSLDYLRFQQMSENENVLFEMISGMQEIKLNNCERRKRWDWERIQAKMYDLGIKGLALGQYQQTGNTFLNQLKNILISYLSAVAVINGEMTLGMMMSVSYIIGQLNSPVQMLLGFMQSAQDAKISFERLSEIHSKEDEEKIWQENKRRINPPNETAIEICNVTYQYTGPKSPKVLDGISLTIPRGKVTAIVGDSGSGKTTLMKLLLSFYSPVSGEIKIDGEGIERLSPNFWRSRSGIVMQEGLIFSDTIANNIAMADETLDMEKLDHAAGTANINSFIDELPMQYQTKIGASGMGISTGQKQRILIARAVYKNPDFIFMDEATSALDANNEITIMSNLHNFYQGRTVVIIAHRLSTVKHADQIIVLSKGKVGETGTHQQLIAQKGLYHQLVSNQLDLQLA